MGSKECAATLGASRMTVGGRYVFAVVDNFRICLRLQSGGVDEVVCGKAAMVQLSLLSLCTARQAHRASADGRAMRVVNSLT